MSTFVPRAVDDSGFVIGTDLVSPMGALCDETSPDSVDEGDAGLVRMTADRKLLTRVVGSTDSSRLEVDSSGRITVAAISTSVTPGTAAANLGKAEDAAHTTGDVGVMLLGVRNSTALTFGADGDYCPIGMSNTGSVGIAAVLDGSPFGIANLTQDATNGGLNVNIKNTSTAVDTELTTADLDTGAGTDTRAVVGLVRAESGGGVLVGSATPLPVDVKSQVPGTAATNLGKAEDAAHTSGDTGVAAWGVANEALSTFGADGDYTPHAVDTKGRTLLGAGTLAIGKLAANSGVDIGDVDVTSVIPGVGATNLGKAIDSAYDITGTGVMMLGVQNNLMTSLVDTDFDNTPIAVTAGGAVVIAGYDGSTIRPIAVDSNGNVAVVPDQGSGVFTMIVPQTAAAAGGAITTTGTLGPVNTSSLLKYYSLMVVETGTVTSWTVTLDISLDGSNFTTLITHTRLADGSGTTKTNPATQMEALASHFRANVSALVLGGGTNIKVWAYGMA